MSRFIDADLLKIEAGVLIALKSSLTPHEVFDLVNKQPAADVVEVVRCKECKHRPHKDEDGYVWSPSWDDLICPCLCDDSYYNWIPEDDFFCKRGERRE